MIFDSDVLIWYLRGNAKAAGTVDDADSRLLSVISYMELMQGARDKRDLEAIKLSLAGVKFIRLPLTENIGQRASIYMEEYAMSTGIELTDALVAATAVEANEPLLTANDKHYRAIKELQLLIFRA